MTSGRPDPDPVSPSPLAILGSFDHLDADLAFDPVPAAAEEFEVEEEDEALDAPAPALSLRPRRAAAAARLKYSPASWSAGGSDDGSPTPPPTSTRTPKVGVAPSQAVAVAAAAAAAAHANAPSPILPPLKLGKRKAVDLESIDDVAERRRQRRLQKNRMTAAVSRERRHAQMQALATTVYELQKEVAAKDAEIKRLRGMLGGGFA